MIKLYKNLIFLLIALIVFSLPLSSSAKLNIDSYSQIIAERAGYQTTEVKNPSYLDTTVGKTIALIMGFVGLIFFLMILVAGFQWLSAGGNEDKVKEATKRIISSTVGFLIIVSAYIITFFVYQTVQNATGEPQPNDWWQQAGGYECQYNVDCTDPLQPFCAWYEVRSFCAECLTDADCNGEQCCTSVFNNFCDSECE
ncbi:MAG TPA: hypothetical protein DEP92_02500 [Candidatus Komeilibacteria bacterium]|nr:hypothetical protein [Candidatus Komeilibacteria bacterium]